MAEPRPSLGTACSPGDASRIEVHETVQVIAVVAALTAGRAVDGDEAVVRPFAKRSGAHPYVFSGLPHIEQPCRDLHVRALLGVGPAVPWKTGPNLTFAKRTSDTRTLTATLFERAPNRCASSGHRTCARRAGCTTLCRVQRGDWPRALRQVECGDQEGRCVAWAAAQAGHPVLAADEPGGAV